MQLRWSKYVPPFNFPFIVWGVRLMSEGEQHPLKRIPPLRELELVILGTQCILKLFFLFRPHRFFDLMIWIVLLPLQKFLNFYWNRILWRVLNLAAFNGQFGRTIPHLRIWVQFIWIEPDFSKFVCVEQYACVRLETFAYHPTEGDTR